MSMLSGLEPRKKNYQKLRFIHWRYIRGSRLGRLNKTNSLYVLGFLGEGFDSIGFTHPKNAAWTEVTNRRVGNKQERDQ